MQLGIRKVPRWWPWVLVQVALLPTSNGCGAEKSGDYTFDTVAADTDPIDTGSGCLEDTDQERSIEVTLTCAAHDCLSYMSGEMADELRISIYHFAGSEVPTSSTATQLVYDGMEITLDQQTEFAAPLGWTSIRAEGHTVFGSGENDSQCWDDCYARSSAVCVWDTSEVDVYLAMTCSESCQG